MHFLDLADQAVLHESHRLTVVGGRVNLNAHLGDDFHLPRRFRHAPHFMEVVREWFLAIDMFI